MVCHPHPPSKDELCNLEVGGGRAIFAFTILQSTVWLVLVKMHDEAYI